MKILNLLEACFIIRDALALRMTLASNKGAKTTSRLMPQRTDYLILLRVRLTWFRIERVTFNIMRTIVSKRLGKFMLENLILFFIMLIVTPGSGGKTECIAYVGQDPFSTHMLTSQV
jgi:hypothetical protein